MPNQTAVDILRRLVTALKEKDKIKVIQAEPSWSVSANTIQKAFADFGEIIDQAWEILELPNGAAKPFKTCTACVTRRTCEYIKHCAGPSIAEYNARFPDGQPPASDDVRSALAPFAKVEYDPAFWERDDAITIDSNKTRFDKAGLKVGHFWDAQAALRSAPVSGPALVAECKRAAIAQKLDEVAKAKSGIYLSSVCTFAMADAILALSPVPEATVSARDAVIEECAGKAITPLNDKQREHAVHGLGSLMSFEKIWNLAQKTSASAIRSLTSEPTK